MKSNSTAKKFAFAVSLTSVLNLAFPIVASANTSATVTVDYSVDKGASNQIASGFLHGMSATSPAQYLIDGVNVRNVRGADYSYHTSYSNTYLPSMFDLTTYNRLKAKNANLEVGLYYRAVSQNIWPGVTATQQQWTDVITEILNESVSKNLDIWSWISWNEPDLQWNTSTKTRAQYFDAHNTAYKAVKAFNSQYRLEAPEISSYNLSFLTSFLTFCKTNSCLPDILTWHELPQTQADIEAHTLEIKNWMIANGITPMPIAVTEYQGQNYDVSTTTTSYPGLNISYLARLERSATNGLAWATKSNWAYSGSNSSFIATLGDTADRSTGTLPNGLWWVYNAYRDMTDRLVQTTSSDKQLSEAFASADSDMARSVILLGTGNFSTSHDPVLQLNNVPAYLQSNNTVHIRAETINNASVLMSPDVAIDGDYVLTSNSLTLALPTLNPKAAYKIYVTPATSAAQKITYEAESLTAQQTSGVTYRIFSESDASGGKASALDSYAVGQYVKFTLNVPTAGVYDLSAVLKNELNRGFFQLYINGVSYGSPKDEYGSSQYRTANFGNISFAQSGDQVLEFRVVGKNSSSSDYRMVFDKFILTKLN